MVDQAKIDHFAGIFCQWMGTLSEAEMATFTQEEEQWKAADEAGQEAMIAPYRARFEAADADGDGVLNLTEYKAMKV